MFIYFVTQTQLVGQLTICNDYDNNHAAFVLFIFLCQISKRMTAYRWDLEIYSLLRVFCTLNPAPVLESKMLSWALCIKVLTNSRFDSEKILKILIIMILIECNCKLSGGSVKWSWSLQ